MNYVKAIAKLMFCFLVFCFVVGTIWKTIDPVGYAAFEQKQENERAEKKAKEDAEDAEKEKKREENRKIREEEQKKADNKEEKEKAYWQDREFEINSLNAWISQSLNDPDSFEPITEAYLGKSACIIFTAKNGFGGRVKGVASSINGGGFSFDARVFKKRCL